MLKRITLVTIAALTLSGCAATHVAISKRDLDVQTKMSDTVFLDPVGADKRTIFLQIRNTSDKPDLSVHEQIAAALQAKGYTLLQDPDAAHYILQANILQVGKSAPTALEAAIDQGYGVAAAGGLVLASGAAYVGGASGRGIAGAQVQLRPHGLARPGTPDDPGAPRTAITDDGGLRNMSGSDGMPLPISWACSR